jgi:uncharacterized protein (TIGR02266 family)
MPSLKILVVDDDIANLELMAEVFTSLQAEVRSISDSQQAADLVSQEKFDGIFLDLEMPKLHGFDLAHLIRSSSWNKSTPIIIVTGRDDRETMQKAFAIGATFFLQKPVDRQKLGSLFRSVRGGLIEQRRRYVRVPLQTEVHCTVGSRSVRGVSWNISMGGLQVEAGSLHQGDTVHLQLQLPGSGVTIDAEGVVVWANQERQGIQFTKLSPENEQSIRQLVASEEQ